MNADDMKRTVRAIQQDPALAPEEKIVVCLNRAWDSMLAGACLVTAGGGFREIFWEASSDDGLADGAVIRMSEDGDDLAAFHETRPSSRDRRPNGIRVHHEDLNFPCVVFCNSGEEPLTVDGEWLAPGEYTVVQEMDINSPEAQRVLEEYIRSPEVLDGIEETRRVYAEMKKARAQTQEKEGRT